MAPYKFDWTATISGTIEIDAENGIEASELFNTLNDQELVEQSEIMRDRNWREIRFVSAELVEVHTGEEWEEIWKEYS
jgi:pyruvate/oxaloacetate carboxyltransferase